MYGKLYPEEVHRLITVNTIVQHVINKFSI